MRRPISSFDSPASIPDTDRCRDTRKFRLAHEARMKAYLVICQVRSDKAPDEIGRILKGFCSFPTPLRYASVRVPQGHTFLDKLCGVEKRSENAA